MGFFYNKLWKILIDKNMKKKDLQEAINTNPTTMSRLSKNENVRMQIFERICGYHDCNIGDIVDYKKEEHHV